MGFWGFGVLGQRAGKQWRAMQRAGVGGLVRPDADAFGAAGSQGVGGAGAPGKDGDVIQARVGEGGVRAAGACSRVKADRTLHSALLSEFCARKLASLDRIAIPSARGQAVENQINVYSRLVLAQPEQYFY